MNHRLRISAVLASAILLLTGCGDVESAQEKATDEYPNAVETSEDFDPDAHLNAAFTAIPPTWDPTQSITNGDYTMYTAVYDRLLEAGRDGEILPMLATSFEPADDNTAMVLELREGLTFSDGTPFNAEAVKFNLDRTVAEGSRLSGEVNMVTGVEVVDPMTVKIKVDGGLGTLAVSLASRAGMMVSPAAVQAGILSSQPVGIGPYVSTSINPGVSIDLAKTPDYWEPDAQKIATRTYTLVADDQAKYNALVSGEVDVAQINPDQLDAAQRAGVNVVVEESPLFLYLGVNTAVAPFDNPEVRKALNMAIDRKGISQGLYSGHCTPGVQLFPESSPGYSEKLGSGDDVFPYDPEEAKKLLEENGATNVQVKAVPPNNTIYIKLAEAVQQQLSDVGITMSIQPMPPAELVQAFAIEKTAETLPSIATVINDPYAVHGRYLTPDALFNPGQADYGELNTIAHDAAVPLDPEERKPLYEEYWDAWVENPPHIIPICTVHLAAAAGEHVAGVYQLPTGSTDVRYASIKK